MDKILKKNSLSQWIKKLESFTIYAPVKKDQVWEYEIIESPDNMELDYPNTVLSPKKIIFPQREVFLEFNRSDENDLEIEEILPEEKPTIVFGVRPCDARALTITDKVFKSDIKDIYYSKKRGRTTLVGLACNTPPSPHCFCTSVGGNPYSKEGLDILMTDLGDRYYIESITEKGNKLINSAKNLFTQPKTEDKKALEKNRTESKKKIQQQIKDIDKIPPKLNQMFDSPFWDEQSLGCIRCGICTYTCPTCHCFDISDEITSSFPLQGKRIRTWDTCQFPNFTMHSSGHNPRPDRASRLRQRIFHKFQYFVERYQEYMCIGCGRCVDQCPVGINIIEILKKVRDYESKSLHAKTS